MELKMEIIASFVAWTNSNQHAKIKILKRSWEYFQATEALTGIYNGLPFVAPLVELLGVLFLHLCPLHKTGHNIVAGLEGLLCPVHRAHVIPRLVVAILINV